MTCPFCNIVSGKSPARILFQDEQVIAFHDIHPIARTHILIVPRQHIASVNELEDGDEPLVGHMIIVAKELAAREGVAQDGYRLILNTGADGGQTILHLHLHLIAGKLARFTLK